MTEETITREPVELDDDERGAPASRLVFITDADDPAAQSSYHALDTLDEVRFRRGARNLERRDRVLTIACPDSWMSGEHADLVRRDGRWILEDLDSKNGTIIDGALARTAPLHDGAVIELGHSFFVFRHTVVEAVPGHLTGDLTAAQLPAWPHGMATFSLDLARELDLLVRLAAGTIPVLLLGETGTGKELIARAIHTLSRRTGDWVAVNCGGVADSLLESELFGHRKGAFTNALADRRGLVRAADGGTLLLDEIGELAGETQVALLRVLQEREVLPLGADRPVPVDLRVIAATHRDLEAAMVVGQFRPDLYARIAGHVLTLPPLRERSEDFGLLLATLPSMTAGDGPPQRFEPAALRALLRHDWPLNIRGLEQMLAKARVLAAGAAIQRDHLPALRRGRTGPPAPPQLSEDDRALRDKLTALFTEHAGNVVAVAAALGKKRSQIYKWVDRLDIKLAEFRRS